MTTQDPSERQPNRRSAERRQLDRALRECEARYRQLIESVHDWVWEVDERGVYTAASPQVFDLLGYKPEEVLGKTPFDLMPSDEATRVAAAFNAIAAKREPFRELANANLHKDGHLIFLESSGMPIFDSSGHYRGYRGMDRDITERKRAGELLQDEISRRRILVDQSTDGIVVLDQIGKVYEANQQYARMLGYSVEEVHDLHMWDWDTQFTKEQLLGMLGAVDETGAHFETRHRRKDGALIDVEISTNGAVLGGRKYIFCVCRDISDRKRAEAALRESEERYQSLVNLSPDAMIVHVDGKWVFANPAAARLFGADSPGELVGQDMIERVHPDYRELAAQRAAQVSAGAVTKPTEIKSLRLDGTAVDVEVNSTKVEFDSRPANQVVLRDITERKQAQEALRESEREVRRKTKFLDSILEHTGAAMAVLQGRELRYTLVNPAYQAIAPNTQMLGRTYREVFPEASAAGAEEASLCVLDTGEPWVIQRYRAPIPGKPDATWEGEVVRLPGEEGEEPSILVVTADVTDRAHTDEALQESHDLLTNLARLVPGVIYQYRLYPDGRSAFPYSSPGMNDIYEVTPEEVQEDATPVFGRLHPEDYDYVAECIKESARTLDTFYCEFRVILPRQGLRWRWSQAHPERTADGGTLWHGIISDITERKQAEEDRLKLERQLQQSQKLESLGVLAGGIAHDFNNILAGVLGNADLALAELSPAAPARQNLLEIAQASHRAAALCRQMLAYSGRGRFASERVDLAAFVKDMLDLLKSSVSKKALFNLNLEKDLPPMDGDPSQLGQVIMNLVINASEALGDEDGVITISTGVMECSARYLRDSYGEQNLPPGLYLNLEVSDTGCGVDAQAQERLFEPFFTTKFTGRGLGLSAVLGIVRGHKGAIRVYSELGKGTTFKVIFPAVEVEGGTLPLKTSAQTAHWQGAGTVLLVDDEETIRTLGARMLSRLGFQVATAADGREALWLYRERREEITLVLLDLTMPHMDGEETLRELRLIDPGVRVVMSSGYTETDVASRFAADGLTGFVQKPYTLAQLREGVRAALQE